MQKKYVSKKISNHNQEKILFEAAKQANYYNMKQALKNKCDPNATDLKGRTPMMVLAKNDNYKHLNTMDCVKLLLNYGAEINKKDNLGNTLLYHVRGRKMCKWLLSTQEGKKQIDVKNKLGLTPLETMKKQNRHQLVIDLIENRGNKAEKIQVFIKNRPGNTKTISCPRNATIGLFKHKIQKKEDIAPDQQRLVYAGQQLDNEKTLVDCNINRDATVHLVLKCKGD